jgi:hypothetical protein
MRQYIVLIGPRDTPRLRLSVMAPDTFTARDQHAALAEPGERMEVRRPYCTDPEGAGTEHVADRSGHRCRICGAEGQPVFDRYGQEVVALEVESA